MPLIRGSNPIWFEVDLTAHAFDDTFYLFVLENDLPYLPATTWKDPDGNVEWTNPIRFLANGTLPNNIYFDPDVVYRLEFRQGDTQQDPLIYLVENYVPGTSGSTPPGDVTIFTDNQVTNAQFPLVNFVSPFAQTSITNPDPIQIGPGWELRLVGTGNVTLNQVALNDSATTINPTNAPYALRITLNGSWTSAKLVQRFQQNGMLWANKSVSSSITAKIEGAPQSISAVLVDSEGTTLGEVLSSTDVNATFNEYTGHALLPASTNTDIPPAAYIEYQLNLPVAVDIFVTSFQLIASDVEIEFNYEQDTIQRQIDHTYHNAYPIMPIGGVIDFAGFTVPDHYFLCDGAAKNRITYSQLFRALTTTETVTLTSGLATFTVVSTANYHVGMALEGTGIQASTMISNIVGTTITMNNTATASGPSSVRFFAWGAGDGSTTFNVPNLQGYVTAGANGSLLSNSNGVGLAGGSATHTLLAAELPPHSHTYSTVTSDGVFGFGFASGTLISSKNFNTGNGPGSSTPFSIVQPTVLMKKCIRYE